MTTIVSELYQALKAAGIEDGLALAAARSVIAAEDKEHLATKADLTELRLTLKADLEALRADLTRTMVTLLIAMTAIFSGISAALRFIK
jgi:hypothetical protein